MDNCYNFLSLTTPSSHLPSPYFTNQGYFNLPTTTLAAQQQSMLSYNSLLVDSLMNEIIQKQQEQQQQKNFLANSAQVNQQRLNSIIEHHQLFPQGMLPQLQPQPQQQQQQHMASLKSAAERQLLIGKRHSNSTLIVKNDAPQVTCVIPKMRSIATITNYSRQTCGVRPSAGSWSRSSQQFEVISNSGNQPSSQLINKTPLELTRPIMITSAFKQTTSISHALYLDIPEILAKEGVLKELTSLFTSAAAPEFDTRQKQMSTTISCKQGGGARSATYVDEATSHGSDTLTGVQSIGGAAGSLTEVVSFYKKLISSRILPHEIRNGAASAEGSSFIDFADSSSSSSSSQCDVSSRNGKGWKVVQSMEKIRSESKVASLTSSTASMLSCINLTAPEKEYEVYTNLTNMCESFIRGEKRKRFKQRNENSHFMSRFHNLNRLFFYQIINIFSYEAISCFSLPDVLAQALRKVVGFVKIHSKLQVKQNNSISSKRCRQAVIKVNEEEVEEEEEEEEEFEAQPSKKFHNSEESQSSAQKNTSQPDFPIADYKSNYHVLKVEAYTHTHYNTLFLKLTPQSIVSLQKQAKDVEAHWLAFKIDLRNPQTIDAEKLSYVNLMKALFYKIFLHFNSVTSDSADAYRHYMLKNVLESENGITLMSCEVKQISLRLDYYIRVVLGVHKLAQGFYSHKF